MEGIFNIFNDLWTLILDFLGLISMLVSVPIVLKVQISQFINDIISTFTSFPAIILGYIVINILLAIIFKILGRNLFHG